MNWLWYMPSLCIYFWGNSTYRQLMMLLNSYCASSIFGFQFLVYCTCDTVCILFYNILYITQKQQLKNLCRQILILFKPYENSLKLNFVPFHLKKLDNLISKSAFLWHFCVISAFFSPVLLIDTFFKYY